MILIPVETMYIYTSFQVAIILHVTLGVRDALSPIHIHDCLFLVLSL